MKLDCPHCGKSMQGKFIRWVKMAKANAHRSCPHCGGVIEYRLHAEELGVRLFTIAVLMAVLYAGHQRPEGFVKPMIVGAIVLAIAWVIALVLSGNKQRYRRGGPGQ